MKQTINASGLILTQNYCYDALNRLSSASENSGANWTQTYDYDRFGNRAVRSGSYLPTPRQTPTSNSPGDLSFLFNQSNNHITATSDYGYDAAGNLSSMPDKTQGVPADLMTYDAENRQRTFNSAGGQYFYDGDGHRVKKVVGSVTTAFVYNASGQLTAEYTNDTTPPVGGGGTSYLTSDHLGSTRLVTGTNQTQPVKARYDYLPFGEEIPSSVGSRGAVTGYGGADSTRQKFTQKERDTESGLDYFLARYYSSAQGRFTSSDEFTGGPVELYEFADDASSNPTFYADLHEPQSLNKYQYSLDNPLRYVDPDGHQAVADALKQAGQVAQGTGNPYLVTAGRILIGVTAAIVVLKDVDWERSQRKPGSLQRPPAALQGLIVPDTPSHCQRSQPMRSKPRRNPRMLRLPKVKSAPAARSSIGPSPLKTNLRGVTRNPRNQGGTLS